MEYELAEEVGTLANELIGLHHKHLRDGNARITYLFRDRAWKTSCQRTILGKAAKRSEIDKILSHNREDFIMIISKPDWQEMTEAQRRILVDHELAHMGVQVTTGGDQKWIIIKHPIEEFPEILARYESERQKLGTLIATPPQKIFVTESKVRRRITVAHDAE